MKLKLLFVFAIIFTANVFAQTPSKVGMIQRIFVDEQRKNWLGNAPRPISTVVWYPTLSAEKEENIVIGNPEKPIFISGAAIRNAEISASKKNYPLIVLSHGTGGSALQMMWLGQYLASRGFIVAAINHHGNTGAEENYAPQPFALWWERTQDLKVAINKLLADSQIGKHIDAKKIGAAGFSIGGTTVTSLAGGVFSIDDYYRFCASAQRDATCVSPPEYATAMKEFEELKTKDQIVVESLKRAGDSFRDKRVKAVFAIAPALGSSFTETSLQSIKIPFEIVVGDADKMTPAKTNAQRIAQSVKKSNLTILPNVTHYTFLGECTDFGKTILPICRDEQEVDRSAARQKVRQMAAEFFRKNL